MLSLHLRSIAKYIIIFALPVFMLSCGGDDAANSGSLKATAKMPVPKRAAPKKVAPKRAAPVVKKTSEDVHRTGLRNPFKSFISPKVAKDERVLGPLECCELGLFRLMAVISGNENPRALVMAPDGQKYITKKGDIMGLRGGKITKIYKNKVRFLIFFHSPRKAVLSPQTL